MNDATHEKQSHLETTYEALVERIKVRGNDSGAVLAGVTWSQLAELLTGILQEYDIDLGNLDEECMGACLQQACDALQSQECNPWEAIARAAMESVLFSAAEPDYDDEGPLTEAYENWTRAEDGWLEAAYEERFELDDF